MNHVTNETVIHPTAIIDPKCQIGKGVKIGPYCIIGPKVQLHDFVELKSHVVIDGRTEIGEHTKIWSFASIGTQPQDLKYRGEDSILICGKSNMIREYANISIGTEHGGGKTVLGNHNLLMMNAHLAHDCIVGDGNIIANGVSLAGHVFVGNKAVIGGHAAVHQFARVGSLAMLAGGAIVVQDVPPYVTVHGNHASPKGLNLVGLQRAGYSTEEIRDVKQMYKILYKSNLPLATAAKNIDQDIPESDVKSEFLTFIQNSQRGFCR